MVKFIKLFALGVINFLKNVFGFPLRLVLLVILIDLPILLGVYLASQRAVTRLEQLEQDLVVVQTTQFNLLQEIATKSATPATNIRPITVVGVK
jgi:hypothetical protein